MTALRSLLFNLYFMLLSGTLAIVYLPLLALPPRYLWAGGRLWVRLLYGGLRLICGLDHRIEGSHHLPQGAAVIASKHQSAWDTLVFMLLLPAPAMVLKRELLHIPLFGWYLRHLDMIAVDRTGGASALQGLLRQARDCLDAGRQVVIFPEGTRTAPGQHRRYQPGIAALYRALGEPVIPIALNSGHYWGRRSFNKRAGTIRLKVLPAIPPGQDRAVFMRQLQSAIDGESDALDRV